MSHTAPGLPLPALLMVHLAACTGPASSTKPASDTDPSATTDTVDDTGDADDSGDTGDSGSSGARDCSAITLDLARLNDARAWVDEHGGAIDSFRVWHCGELVVNEAYNGYSATTPHDLQSATKTWVAMLVGVALDEGLIADLDQPIAELLPHHAGLLTGDKAAITVRHLLTMTSGLAWRDFGFGNSFEAIAAADDSVAYVLGEALETAPGATFHYNTGSSHLLAAIVAEASGQSTAEYAQQHLFDPMGIPAPEWQALPDGRHQGGWGIFMAPEDFEKLGILLLDGGVWQDQPLVPAQFVDEATAWQVENDYDTGGYGYQMWIETALFDADDLAAARGYGGQDCIVLEDLDTVITFNGAIGAPAAMARNVPILVNDYILPAHEVR